jgi:predicted lipoprotein with Yx(FWY)xxD motif
VVVAASMAALAGCEWLAVAQVPVHRDSGVFVDEKGMTLYTFDRDAKGRSACNAQCAVNWPPLVAAAGAKAAGDYTIVVRDDGREQWAYKGKPLYRWVKDREPGDRTGDGVNNLWRVARP